MGMLFRAPCQFSDKLCAPMNTRYGIVTPKSCASPSKTRPYHHALRVKRSSKRGNGFAKQLLLTVLPAFNPVTLFQRSLRANADGELGICVLTGPM